MKKILLTFFLIMISIVATSCTAEDVELAPMEQQQEDTGGQTGSLNPPPPPVKP